MNSEEDWTREQEIEKQKDKSVAQNVGLILSGNVVKEKKKISSNLFFLPRATNCHTTKCYEILINVKTGKNTG